MGTPFKSEMGVCFERHSLSGGSKSVDEVPIFASSGFHGALSLEGGRLSPCPLWIHLCPMVTERRPHRLNTGSLPEFTRDTTIMCLTLSSIVVSIVRTGIWCVCK